VALRSCALTGVRWSTQQIRTHTPNNEKRDLRMTRNPREEHRLALQATNLAQPFIGRKSSASDSLVNEILVLVRMDFYMEKLH
jgi:hypothetical protein